MTDLSGIQSALAGAVHDLVDGLLGDLLGFGPNVLLALSTNTGIQPTDLIGQPVLLELLTAHSTTALRPFHGHVLGFELLGSEGGYARYRLQIGAWLDFLRHRTDAWIFQDQSVVEITEAVFADYAAQGTLQPKWRWDLKDAGVYPKLSTLSQHAETDFDFLQRLWAANGLFCWFEHAGDLTNGPPRPPGCSKSRSKKKKATGVTCRSQWWHHAHPASALCAPRACMAIHR